MDSLALAIEKLVIVDSVVGETRIEIETRKPYSILFSPFPHLIRMDGIENYEINFMVEKNLLFCASNIKPIKFTCFPCECVLISPKNR